MSAVMKDTSSPAPIRAIFDRLADKAPELALSTAEQRSAKLQALLQATLAARPAIIRAGQNELKVHETDIDGQLLMIKSNIEFIVKHLQSWMRDEPVPAAIMTLGKKCYLKYEPKGVILHLSTWNAPIAEAFIMAAGAIAAGNAFVLKPSELAPESSQVLADIVASCMAQDEFAVVQGGADVAQALLACPFNHIFYIGSQNVGRIVMKAAADHLASVTLEMGGKNPAIIDASADVEDAAYKIAWGRAANAGQVCVAPDYALVHSDLERPFIAALGRAFTAMYNPDGQGFAASDHLPRIVNDRHFQRICALRDDALAKGAKLEFGGGSDAATRFIEPTVLSQVDASMTIMQEEIFGPILCIVPFTRREDAIREIRSHPKPLSSYVFARDQQAIDWFMNRTTAGNSVVNHNLIQSGTNPHLPFGGINASGNGRVNGKATFLECSNTRSVVVEGPILGDPKLIFPPYSDQYKKMVAQMLAKPIHIPDRILNLINRLILLFGRLRGR